MLHNFVLPEYSGLNPEYSGFKMCAGVSGFRDVRVSPAQRTCATRPISPYPTSTSPSAPSPSRCLSSPQNTHLLLLALSPNQAMEEEPPVLTNLPPPSPEFDGGPAKDDGDELFHHLSHLFLARHQGEGHLQASPSSSPSPKDELDLIYANAALLQQVAPSSRSTHHW